MKRNLKNPNPINAKSLAFLSVVAVVAAFAAPPVKLSPADAPVRKKVPYDRKLILEPIVLGSSLYNLATKQNGADVRGFAMTDLGRGFTTRIDQLRLSGGSTDGVNAKIDAYLQKVMQVDLTAADKIITDRISEISKHHTAARDAFNEETKKAEAQRAADQTSELSDVDSAKAQRLSQLRDRFGGLTAIDVLTKIKVQAEDSVLVKEARVNRLVAEIASWTERVQTIDDVKANRVEEISTQKLRVAQAEVRLNKVAAALNANLAAAQEARKKKIDALNKSIAELEGQRVVVARDYDAQFKALYPEIRKTVATTRDFWQFFGKSEGDITHEARKKANEQIFAKTPSAQGAHELIQSLIKQKKALIKTRDQLSKELADLAWNKLDFKEFANQQELLTEHKSASDDLNFKRTQLAAFVQSSHELLSWTPLKTVNTDYYPFEGRFVSGAELDQLRATAVATRNARLTELEGLDVAPKEVEGSESERTHTLAQRVLAAYKIEVREKFQQAYDATEKIAQESKDIDTETESRRKEVTARYAQAQAAAAAAFGEKIAEFDHVTQNDKDDAEAQYKIAQQSFEQLRSRLAVSLQDVVACAAASTTAAPSPRTFIQSISADVNSDTILAMNSFNDFTRTKIVSNVKHKKITDVTYNAGEEFKSFVSIVFDGTGNTIAFETASDIAPTPLTMEGSGILAAQDPAAKKPARGLIEFRVNQFNSAFTVPLSYAPAGHYTFVSCAKTTNGLELKRRKFDLESSKPHKKAK